MFFLSFALHSALIAAPDAIKGLITGNSNEVIASAELLSEQPPESLAVWIGAFNDFPSPDTTGWAIELKHVINDTLTAPAWLYIPTSYSPKEPTPLVISLHGGVSGAKFRDASTKNWHEDTVFQLAEKNGWLVLFPLGMTGCAWWDKTGMENILWYIREIKRQYNIDDDRVAMCGFSDGASGSYHFGMLAPTDFAVFFPWSGHPSVGTEVSGIQTYLENLRNRPLFASNGGKDQLYPTEIVEPSHRLMFKAGVPLSVSYCDTAGHNSGYMPNEWSKMADRFARHPRDSYKADLTFTTADIDFNHIDWLQINALDTLRDSSSWYFDLNLKETDDRISIGFNNDPEYKGKGIRVAGVSRDPESPAVKAGMQPGDIVIQVDDVKIVGMPDIVKAKEGRKRGDTITLTFKRGSKKHKVETFYPPVRVFDVYPRRYKSGSVRALHVGNKFEIESMRVSSVKLLLSRDLIRFEQPVNVVIVQGGQTKEVHNSVVVPDSKVMLNNFIQSHDRKRLVFAEIDVEIPVVF